MNLALGFWKAKVGGYIRGFAQYYSLWDYGHVAIALNCISSLVFLKEFEPKSGNFLIAGDIGKGFESQ